jgi:hypothetical protein
MVSVSLCTCLSSGAYFLYPLRQPWMALFGYSRPFCIPSIMLDNDEVPVGQLIRLEGNELMGCVLLSVVCIIVRKGLLLVSWIGCLIYRSDRICGWNCCKVLAKVYRA